MLSYINYKLAKVVYSLSAVLSLLVLLSPVSVLANNNQQTDFSEKTETTKASDLIRVDAQTAKRLGIKVEPVTRQQLAVGIKTTGQIETLPNQKVEVKAPVSGILVELLVKPGAKVKQGQIVAVLSSSELAQLRVESVQKQAEALPGLQQAQADLLLAQQNYERQQTIVATDLKQARSQLALATERYNRDKELLAAGAIARRQVLENEAKLTEAQALVAKAASRLPVLEAQSQLKRATAAVEIAQSRIRLSSAGYEARLQQLGTRASSKGLVNVTAPISGTVADRAITPGETITVEAGSKPLMTILNDSQVWATANIYEKDLNKVKLGQQARVFITSLPNLAKTGRITFIGSVVEGATRVVPVKAELDNSSSLLKPGMFARLEIITNDTPTPILAINSTAVVESDGKQIVFVQKDDDYARVEVTLGQTSGGLVEVKNGLVEGEQVVIKGASLLYAKSLGDSGIAKDNDDKGATQKNSPNTEKTQLPLWLVAPAGLGLAIAFWAGRRQKPREILLDDKGAKLNTIPEQEETTDKATSSQDSTN